MPSAMGERRASPRYPIPVPVRFRLDGGRFEARSHVADLSAGGLSFRSVQEIPEGSELEVAFPFEDTRFVLRGSVVRCLCEGSEYRVGICFLQPEERFRVRLAEQVLRIHELRRELSLQREEEVSTEEAARDWIEYYAREFAELYDREL